MRGQYILEGKQPVPCDDLITWGKWMQDANRHVAKEERDGVMISTVFLGLDHAYPGENPYRPMLFETMIFGGEHDQHQERCSTWEQAEEMHKTARELAFGKEASNEPA